LNFAFAVPPIASDVQGMRIRSTSFAFTLLLGFLAAVPYSGIDINLPALSATRTTLNASAADVGLTISAFVLSLAVMPLMYGPASDRAPPPFFRAWPSSRSETKAPALLSASWVYCRPKRLHSIRSNHPTGRLRS